MKEVYEGKLALMDWGDSLSTAIDTAFTLPNGQALVHMASDVNFATSSYTSYLFHPMNPWIDRFRRDVSALYEAGVQLKLIAKNKWDI